MALTLSRGRDEVKVLMEQAGIPAAKIPGELVDQMLNYSYIDVVDRLNPLERQFTTTTIADEDDAAVVEDTYALDIVMEKPKLIFLNDIESVPVGYEDIERLKIEATDC